MDYFALLSLPKQFACDLDTLKHAHIDAVRAGGDENLLNIAFDILKNADTRTDHLLALANQQLDKDSALADGAFLAQMMDLRILLDEDGERAQVLDKTNALLKTHGDNFWHFYQTGDWQNAKIEAQKIRFIAKIHAAANVQSTSTEDDWLV